MKLTSWSWLCVADQMQEAPIVLWPDGDGDHQGHEQYTMAPFGTAFGRLAKPGLDDKLRHSGMAMSSVPSRQRGSSNSSLNFPSGGTDRSVKSENKS
jgi:hypothetical protein